MTQELYDFFIANKPRLVQAAIVLAIILGAFIALRLFNRFISETQKRHRRDERRTHGIAKLGRAAIYLVTALAVSNILGYEVKQMLLATSSVFVLIGVAFFAYWSVLSNMTASVVLYFTFPYRIGDRIVIENEPAYIGILRDINLFHLTLENPSGSRITIPSNVAVQKIVTILSEADYQKRLQAMEEKPSVS